MNFKLSNIPGNTVYINDFFSYYYFQIKTYYFNFKLNKNKFLTICGTPSIESNTIRYCGTLVAIHWFSFEVEETKFKNFAKAKIVCLSFKNFHKQ